MIRLRQNLEAISKCENPTRCSPTSSPLPLSSRQASSPKAASSLSLSRYQSQMDDQFDQSLLSAARPQKQPGLLQTHHLLLEQLDRRLRGACSTCSTLLPHLTFITSGGPHLSYRRQLVCSRIYGVYEEQGGDFLHKIILQTYFCSSDRESGLDLGDCFCICSATGDYYR